MSANNIVVFEEQTNGTFNAYHRDMDCYCEGQYSCPDTEPPIFHAATMRECVKEYEKWLMDISYPVIEYGYVFELRADNRADPS